MKTIRSETPIDAAPQVVWKVITDFAAYPTWNPFITSIEGDVRVGGRLRATFVLAGRKPWTFTPKVTTLDFGRRFAWLGHLVIPGLFDGEHGFEVEPDREGSIFIHTENFRGLLPPLMARTISATHDAFTRMDIALKDRAEAIARSTVTGERGD